MAQTIQAPAPSGSSAPGASASAYLDCERLDVYRVAVEFPRIAAGLCAHRRVGATLRDQLDRASVSIVLTIAEGAGRCGARDKAHFFAIARGSATECAAILDLLEARGLIASPARRHARGLLVRVVQMLTRLIARHTLTAREARP
jgi:four helix bundle protein